MLPKLPMVLGHEVAGVVSQVGPEVSGVEIGDRVVILGPQQHARDGGFADSGFADKVLATAEGLFTLPEPVDFVQGATATDVGRRRTEPLWEPAGFATANASASAFVLDVILHFAGFGTTTAGAISAVRPAGGSWSLVSAAMK